MSSRAKKKNAVRPTETPRGVEADKKPSTRYFVIWTLFSVLFLAALCVPVTGFSFSVTSEDLELGASDKSVEISHRMNAFQLLLAPASDFTDWTTYLQNAVVPQGDGLAANFSQALAQKIMNDKFTDADLRLLDSAMWAIYGLVAAVAALWLAATAAMLFGLRRRRRLPAAIAGALLALLTLIQWIALIAAAVGGRSDAAPAVEVGAYLLPLLAIAVSVYSWTDICLRKKRKKDENM